MFFCRPTGVGEKDAPPTSERPVFRVNGAFLPGPLEGAAPIGKIFMTWSARMGFAEAFDYQKPADILCEFTLALDTAASHIPRVDLDLSILLVLMYAV